MSRNQSYRPNSLLMTFQSHHTFLIQPHFSCPDTSVIQWISLGKLIVILDKSISSKCSPWRSSKGHSLLGFNCLTIQEETGSARGSLQDWWSQNGRILFTCDWGENIMRQVTAYTTKANALRYQTTWKYNLLVPRSRKYCPIISSDKSTYSASVASKSLYRF